MISNLTVSTTWRTWPGRRHAGAMDLPLVSPPAAPAAPPPRGSQGSVAVTVSYRAS